MRSRTTRADRDPVILADTCAWVQYDRATASAVDRTTLLAHDADLARIARVVSVDLDGATPPA